MPRHVRWGQRGLQDPRSPHGSLRKGLLPEREAHVRGPPRPGAEGGGAQDDGSRRLLGRASPAGLEGCLLWQDRAPHVLQAGGRSEAGMGAFGGVPETSERPAHFLNPSLTASASAPSGFAGRAPELRWARLVGDPGRRASSGPSFPRWGRASLPHWLRALSGNFSDSRTPPWSEAQPRGFAVVSSPTPSFSLLLGYISSQLRTPINIL